MADLAQDHHIVRQITASGPTPVQQVLQAAGFDFDAIKGGHTVPHRY